MRDPSDVCGARNTQFEQEFLGLFRAETVSAFDWRDRIGDFCVAEYLTELDTVHVVRYSTRFSLTCAVRAHAFPTSDKHGENALRLRETESLGLLHDLRRSPNWKTLSSRLVGPTGSVLVPYFGGLFLAESRAELDQCWPQTGRLSQKDAPDFP